MPRRVWYWPAWQMTHWWKVTAWRGGDEYDRSTLSIHLGPLGCVNIATSESGHLNWRCECGDTNSMSEWCCYRCGAGQPEDDA